MSASHLAGLVGVHRFVYMVEAQHERESHGNFGGGHGEDEEEHDLAVRLSPAAPGRDEGEPGGVQHDLNGHEYEDQVAPHQQSHRPQ